MTELRVRDLFSLSSVLGLMVGTMSFFMYIFANGMDVSNLDRAIEVGAIAGGVTGIVFLCYTSVRYVERNRRLAEAQVEVDPLDRLQALLQSVEESSSSLPWAEERPWMISTHVRRDRGVMTVDLHDLDLKQSRYIVDQIIASRGWIGRVRIITGRGLKSKTVPKIRPMVIERLRGVTRSLNWELLMKKGSVTLRPIGEAPTFRKWLFRFVFLGGPITVAFAFAFRDLAGEGAYDQGLRVGIILGMLLSGLLASYRERQ
ncbi:MAG: hypothetical protein VYA86_01140 [Candidatus Thermoplasmatota archaeon]|nr:hypothetical protein [Candidatus Thermoplasmatota archaeon]